jgi:hypothetical protein
MLAGALRFNPRPDLCSQVLVVVLLALLVTGDTCLPRDGPVLPPAPPPSPTRQWRLWCLPPLMVLWANLHVGFVVGVVIIGLYGLNRLMRWHRRRSSADLLALAPCALACVAWVLNPYGIRVLSLPGKLRRIPGLTTMLFEWMPLVNLRGAANLPWFSYAALLVLLTLCAAALAVRTTRVPPWQWLTAAFLLAITWNARRQLGILGIALPVLMLPHLAGFEALLSRRRVAAYAGICAASAAIVWGQASGRLTSTGGWPTASFMDTAFPVAGAEFLKASRPPGNMYNTYHYGGYLAYQLGPETKLFIDGRVDTYDPQVWVDNRAIEAGTMPLEEAVAKYGLNSFVLDPRPGYDPGGMVARVGALKGWRSAYRDANCAVFVREPPAGRPLPDAAAAR